MSHKSWQLDRRSFLQGAGIALTLPYLDAMADSTARSAETPKRLCFMYFPNGCGIPDKKKYASEHQKWSWFPMGQGADYQFTNTLEVLQPHRSDISILGGLSHTRSRPLRSDKRPVSRRWLSRLTAVLVTSLALRRSPSTTRANRFLPSTGTARFSSGTSRPVVGLRPRSGEPRFVVASGSWTWCWRTVAG